MRRLALLVLLLAASASQAGERKDFYGDPLPSGAVARMGTIRLRVDGRVVAFSPDEKMFAVTSWTYGVSLWSTETGLPLRDLEQSPGRQRDFAFSVDGKSFLTVGREGIHEWQTADGKLLQTVKLKNNLELDPLSDHPAPVLSRDGILHAARNETSWNV